MMNRSGLGLMLAGGTLFILAVSMPSTFGLGSIVGASSSNTGVLIPLYTYPTDSSWSQVVQAKQAYPSVPIIAIINPNSGVGTSQDSNYVTGVNNLKGAGVLVLGYVWTDYGQRPIAQVESEMSQYRSWYNVNGVFLDGAQNQPGSEGYYSALSSYATSIGLSNTVENQGATTSTSYIGTTNLIVPYESAGEPSPSSFSIYPRSEVGLIVYSQPSLDVGWINAVKPYAAYVYVTDDGLPNPYDTLPSYFLQEVAALATTSQTTTTMQSTFTQTSTVVSATTYTTTVQGMPNTFTQTVTQSSTVINRSPSFSVNTGEVLGGLIGVVGATMALRGKSRA